MQINIIALLNAWFCFVDRHIKVLLYGLQHTVTYCNILKLFREEHWIHVQLDNCFNLNNKTNPGKEQGKHGQKQENQPRERHWTGTHNTSVCVTICPPFPRHVLFLGLKMHPAGISKSPTMSGIRLLLSTGTIHQWWKEY